MDNIIGIGRITNFFEHPHDTRYMVYVFYKKTYADYFQELLVDRDVVFERYLDPDSEHQRILFGVSKRFRKEANNCNFLTHAKYRRPFIKSKVGGVALVVITFAIVAIAIIGYIKS